MTEADALLRIAVALEAIKESLNWIGFVLLMMLLFKNMGTSESILNEIKWLIEKISRK